MYYVSVFYDDGMIITSSLLSFPYVMVKVSLKAIWKSPSSFICASESAVVYKRDEERRLKALLLFKVVFKVYSTLNEA